MKAKISKVAVAAAIVGFLGFGGVSLAYAQTSPSTPPSTVPASHGMPPGPRGGGNPCPNMDGHSAAPTSSPDT